MPYVQGARVHGVVHVADVFHSSNVFVNHVPVALWLDPEGSEAASYAAISAPTYSVENVTVLTLEGESESDSSVVATQQALVEAGVITQAQLDAGNNAGTNPNASDTNPGANIQGNTTATVSVVSTDSSVVDATLLLSAGQSASGIDYYVRTVTKQVSPTNRYGVIFPYDVASVAPANGFTITEVCQNLELLVKNCFDPIKAKYPKAFMTCSFRAAGRGSPTSQHPKGQACDIQFAGASKADYFPIAQWIRDNVSFDQLILEYKTTGSGMPWIHISFNKAGNRNQVFTFMNDRNCKGPGVTGLYDLSNT